MKPAQAYVLTMLGVLFIFLVGVAAGLITFRYPVYIENEPFNSPIKVTRVEGQNMYLADSRVLKIQLDSGGELEAALSESGHEVDVVGDDLVVVYGRRNGWICGAGWDQVVTIPLFPETIYKNRREMLTFGSVIKLNDAKQSE